MTGCLQVSRPLFDIMFAGFFPFALASDNFRKKFNTLENCFFFLSCNSLLLAKSPPRNKEG